jgi:hypothetical protein
LGKIAQVQLSLYMQRSDHPQVLALRAGVHSIAPEVYSLLPKFVFRYTASSWFGVQLAGGPLKDLT